MVDLFIRALFQRVDGVSRRRIAQRSGIPAAQMIGGLDPISLVLMELLQSDGH